jgi:hypothetical protein
VRVALAGNYDAALEKMKKGESALSGGVLTLCIFIAVAITSALLSSFIDHTPNYITALINILLGLVFGLPAVLIGLRRIRNSKSLLENPEAAPRVQSEESRVQLPKAPLTDRSISDSQFRDIVTEHTTLELKPPEQVR